MMPTGSLQALINGMSQQWQKERAESQMTLGQLIKCLKKMDFEQRIIGLGRLYSYRGYYCDLAFEPTTQVKEARQLLSECRAAMGKIFEGWKGGDYVMGENTPLWVAGYGNMGPKLMGLKDGTILMPIVEEEE